MYKRVVSVVMVLVLVLGIFAMPAMASEGDTATQQGQEIAVTLFTDKVEYNADDPMIVTVE